MQAPGSLPPAACATFIGANALLAYLTEARNRHGGLFHTTLIVWPHVYRFFLLAHDFWAFCHSLTTF